MCSGNTCRSPMATAIATAAAAKRGYELEIRSAGLMAPVGSPASAPAVAVAAARGLDLSAHRAAQLDSDDLEWADLVLGMTHSHVDAIRRQAPGLRTIPVTAFLATDNPRAGMGIEDPLGGTAAEYERVWADLEQAVAAMLERISESTDRG
ncbi:MAG: low molecular weight protein arginine phosphatase [Gemmatimonadota bacterium]